MSQKHITFFEALQNDVKNHLYPTFFMSKTICTQLFSCQKPFLPNFFHVKNHLYPTFFTSKTICTQLFSCQKPFIPNFFHVKNHLYLTFSCQKPFVPNIFHVDIPHKNLGMNWAIRNPHDNDLSEHHIKCCQSTECYQNKFKGKNLTQNCCQFQNHLKKLLPIHRIKKFLIIL